MLYKLFSKGKAMSNNSWALQVLANVVKAIFSCRSIQFWCTGEYSRQQDCVSGIDLK